MDTIFGALPEAGLNLNTVVLAGALATPAPGLVKINGLLVRSNVTWPEFVIT